MRRLMTYSLLRTLCLLVAAATMTTVADATAQSLRSGGYFCGTDGSCQWFKPGDPSWLFERFTYAMGYADCAGNIDTWRTQSPGCILTLYTTGTDMPAYKSYTSNSYLFGKKSTYVRDRMVELGDIEENAYLHFYDDTRLRYWNGSGYDTLLIPGTYSMTVTNADSASRVPNSYINYFFHSGVTYNSDARLSPNFTSQSMRQAYKEFITQAFNEQMTQHWPDATGTWDGLYFDNYSPWAMIGSGLVSGGHVVETGSDPANLLQFSTDPYGAWCWDWMKVFGREVRDTLHMADRWAIDGQKKMLCYNVGMSHRDDYLDPNLSGADALNYEFAFDPVYSNNESYYRLENIHTRDSIGTSNGVTSFWTSRPRTSYGNGYTSKRQAIYNNLCFYYIARTDSTWIFMRPEPGNAYGVFYNPGFDTLAWIAAMEYDIGNPVGHYQLAASGASPDQGGATYKIWKREFDSGVVYMRPRDGFDAAWGDPSTPIDVDLGSLYQIVQLDGTLAEPASSISLSGAEGAILVPVGGSDFTATPHSGYAPLNVSFTAQLSSPVTNWYWDFGDGGSSMLQNPQHTYSDPGVYSVQLIGEWESGADTIVKYDLIAVATVPEVEFSASPNSGFAPLVVSFSNESDGEFDSWQWDFGDGVTATTENTQHVYAGAGGYSVQLIGVWAAGADTVMKANLISVSEAPLARFAATPTNGCGPLTVSFIDQSEGVIDTWQWDFGDGEFSNARNPEHVYSTPGNYSVSLTVSHSQQSDDTTASDLIHVEVDTGKVAMAFALQDLPSLGIIGGDYLATQQCDAGYEHITEELSGYHPFWRVSLLDHSWLFEVPAAETTLFLIQAHRSYSFDGDNFAFEYSTDNVNFHPLLTVSTTIDSLHAAELQGAVSGIVWVRVRDTNRHWRGNSADTIYIDQMYIETSGTPSEPDTLSVTSLQVTRRDRWRRWCQAVVEMAVQNQQQETVPHATGLVEQPRFLVE